MEQAEMSRRDTVRGKLLEMMPKGAVCAEIGVWEGNFSRRILDICEPKQLHLIDPWLYQPEFGNTGFGRKKNEDRMDEMYQEVVASFKSDKRVTVHRAKSDEALAKLADHSLDWVYVDGNHNEPFIDNDLAPCLQKVKPGGVIAGDDYNWQSDRSGAPVRRAVEKVMEDLGDGADLMVMANQYIIRLKPA